MCASTTGHIDNVDLTGINVGLMMDAAGHHVARQLDGDAVFVDDKAPIQAVKGLTRIFTGRVGGTHASAVDPGRDSFSGVHQVPIALLETDSQDARIRIEKYVDGAITRCAATIGTVTSLSATERVLDRAGCHRRQVRTSLVSVVSVATGI